MNFSCVIAQGPSTAEVTQGQQKATVVVEVPDPSGVGKIVVWCHLLPPFPLLIGAALEHELALVAFSHVNNMILPVPDPQIVNLPALNPTNVNLVVVP